MDTKTDTDSTGSSNPQKLQYLDLAHLHPADTVMVYKMMILFMQGVFTLFQRERKLSRDTFYLALALLQKIASNKQLDFCLSTLEMYVKVALCVASKYEDMYALYYSLLEDVSPTTTPVDKLIACERQVLRAVDYSMKNIVTMEHIRCAMVVCCKHLGIGYCIDACSSMLLDVVATNYNLLSRHKRHILGRAVVVVYLSSKERSCFEKHYYLITPTVHYCIEHIEQTIEVYQLRKRLLGTSLSKNKKNTNANAKAATSK